MAERRYDLFVIGAGSGGVRASRAAARHGARVAVAECGRLGGTCVNVGCIPKKLFVYAAHYREDFRDAAGYGWTVPEPSFDWPTLRRNKDREIERLNGVYQRLLDQAGVQTVRGRARIVDAHTVEVDGQRFETEHIVVATGSWPFVPDVPGAEHAITSNEAFALDALPRRALVVGGGYIAVEFAGIFHGLGVEVTQLYRGSLFLRGFDGDLRKNLAKEMQRQGIDLRFDADVHKLARTRSGIEVQLQDGGVIETDLVLYATGRAPLTGDLGLQGAGVRLRDNGSIPVDEYSRTCVPSIHAVGDVTDRVNLTPVAIAEAEALARTLFGGRPTPFDHSNVPSAVFSQPALATVGLSEESARRIHPQIDIYRSEFRPLRNTLSGNEGRSLMKLVVDRTTDRVLGVHVLGPEAGEIVQGFAVAVKMGATKAQLDATIGIHPSAAEELVQMREPIRDAETKA
jgi:glutathione reductase (NADPH)